MADRGVANAVFLETRLDVLDHLCTQSEQPVKQLVKSQFGCGIEMCALHEDIMWLFHDTIVKPTGARNPQARFGNSCINPPAMNSTATAARINPMTRVVTLMP